MRFNFMLICLLQPLLAKEKCSKCGTNEMDTSKDKCLCEWELSCDAPIPGGCTDKCAERECSCKQGFYRNRDNKCVPWKECPEYNKEYGPCALAFCAGGTCEDVETECGNPPCPLRPECKPVSSPSSSARTFYDCSNYPCRRCDDTCTMVNEEGCFFGNCTSHPECIPSTAYSCLEFDKDCRAKGEVCRMIPVQCYTCPCYPLPHCVPEGTLAH